jgi:hypothetical protein
VSGRTASGRMSAARPPRSIRVAAIRLPLRERSPAILPAGLRPSGHDRLRKGTNAHLPSATWAFPCRTEAGPIAPASSTDLQSSAPPRVLPDKQPAPHSPAAPPHACDRLAARLAARLTATVAAGVGRGAPGRRRADIVRASSRSARTSVLGWVGREGIPHPQLRLHGDAWNPSLADGSVRGRLEWWRRTTGARRRSRRHGVVSSRRRSGV